MKLIAIAVAGEPSEPIINLPVAAREVGAAYKSLYEVGGYKSPWLGYFAIVDGCCVGTCGFKSPPENNRVEIAYFTFPDYEGKGIATQMAKALVTIAIDADPRIEVAAQTLPVDSASTTILRKLGFENVGAVIHPEDGEVWEWRYVQDPH